MIILHHGIICGNLTHKRGLPGIVLVMAPEHQVQAGQSWRLLSSLAKVLPLQSRPDLEAPCPLPCAFLRLIPFFIRGLSNEHQGEILAALQSLLVPPHTAGITGGG